VQVSAKADYAVRALLELASRGGGPVKGDELSRAQDIPPKFLEAILTQLRQTGLLNSRRGADGGYWLAYEADQISLADIIRAVDGPLASVRGLQPEAVTYEGAASRLTEVWVALRSSLRAVLEEVSLADLLSGELPTAVGALLDDPAARFTR
jgi:Rrf2 family protein